MSFKAKHIVEEINGVRCTIVEKGISKSRVDFLQALLVLNKMEVLTAEVPKETEESEQLYVLGVTDIVFNPLIAVFEMTLKTAKGEPVTAPYWNQQTAESVKEYWEF